MKKIFKYIVRKVDEKVANNLKEIKEIIKEIKEISNDNESKKVISNIMIGVGVGVSVIGLLIKADMIIK